MDVRLRNGTRQPGVSQFVRGGGTVSVKINREFILVNWKDLAKALPQNYGKNGGR
jgi:hypothetical protein